MFLHRQFEDKPWRIYIRRAGGTNLSGTRVLDAGRLDLGGFANGLERCGWVHALMVSDQIQSHSSDGQ